MGEWIKLKDQPPPLGARVIVFFSDGGHIGLGDSSDFIPEWTHWMPLPPPPPSTVMVELSEDDVRYFVRYSDTVYPYPDLASGRLYAACRKALEAKR